ncbi:TetR/AcrR family transcriptional regulator [uncultured Methanoregula sp.]|uniref:TetR/AcrR family transcriptional regulator n=1 Tax=uncultured Methanoregula sp. TaxID=1005933 RepID=UPI002AABE89F|nr:TetR/AcrR family transcriptional regulator [uncultured Methanoregula sp.]
MPEPGSDKQEAILDAALRLFTKRGFFGTPTSLISKEAGVATGTLFFYFKTKEELIDTLYLRVKAEAAQAMCRDLEEEPDAKAKLNRLGRNAIAWGMEHPEKMKFMEYFAHSPFVSSTAQEEGMSRFLFLMDLIDQGIREGSIRDCDKKLLIFMMASSFSGLIARIAAAESDAERERIIDQGMEFIWSGFAADTVKEQKNNRKKPIKNVIS